MGNGLKIMANIRNDALSRTLMFVFFGVAALFLYASWRLNYPISSNQRDGEPVKTVSKKTTASPQPNPVKKELEPKSQSKEYLDSSSANAATLEANSKQSFSIPSSSVGVKKEMPGTNITKNTEVVVDLGDRRTYVRKNNTVIASYPIAIGKEGWETPTGSFQVIQMQKNPSWRHPITGQVFPSGKDSPLGERWISFWSDGKNQIGFHGTPDHEVIGTAISHGCLRMRNADVVLLYKQIAMGTTVVVKN
jgi:lipoprotein-anchoring transpeptidase ErfK/SrfK